MKNHNAIGNPGRILAGTSALLLGALLTGTTSANAAEAPETPKSGEPAGDADDAELLNWVQFGVGGNFISGDKAQFQTQKGLPSGAFGGLEGFHFETPFDKKGLFTIDGRGVFDNHDYSVKLELSHPDKGYVRAGYSQYRIYYDGLGGYLPSNGRIFQGLFDNNLAVDRAHTFFEAGLTLPDKPVISFRYDLDTRDGLKDSTHWGTTTLTPGNLQKKITPAFRDLDETRHTFSLDVKHALGNTEFGVGGRYEIQENKDSRSTYQQPTQGTTARILTQDEGIAADIASAHAYTDTKLSDKWEFTTGYAFSTLHSVLSGDRINTPIVTPLSAADTRFANLAGGSDLNQYVMNLNLMYSPSTNWYVIPSVRVEKEDLNGSATDNVVTGTATQVTSPATQFANNDKSSLYVTEALDIRYSGIKNWAFYTRVELSEDRSNLAEQFGTNITKAATILRDTEWNRLLQKYTVGANWYPSRKANFGAQYYHRISDNDYHNSVDSTSNAGTSGDRFPAYLGNQNFDVDDFNVRMTLRLLPTLTMVTRYDFQLSTAYTQPELLAGIESARNRRHLIGQTLSWTPLNWLYVQANGNYVLSTTHSPVEELTGAMTGVVLSAPNDYWTAGLTLGFAIDDKTDLQTGYSYYRANNYVDNSTVGLPYGAGAREHEVSVSMTRKISKAMRWNLRYAFSSYHDETSGGALNYEAHGILSSLQYRF